MLTQYTKYFAIPYFIFIINNLWHEFSLSFLKNYIHMVIYLIYWERDPDFPRKDLTSKQKDKSYFVVTCLCRNIHNALRCAEWYFERVMGVDGKLCFSDGQVRFTTCKIDSRHFDCTYLLLDGMIEPFDLVDPKSNFNQFTNIF